MTLKDRETIQFMLGIIEGATCNMKGFAEQMIGDAICTIDEILDKDGLVNGVTAQEWISVKDRLPEKWQNVFAVRSDGKMRFDFICSTGCWYDDVNYVGHSVTHWMPLPQPPKGE